MDRSVLLSWGKECPRSLAGRNPLDWRVFGVGVGGSWNSARSRSWSVGLAWPWASAMLCSFRCWESKLASLCIMFSFSHREWGWPAEAAGCTTSPSDMTVSNWPDRREEVRQLRSEIQSSHTCASSRIPQILGLGVFWTCLGLSTVKAAQFLFSPWSVWELEQQVKCLPCFLESSAVKTCS